MKSILHFVAHMAIEKRVKLMMAISWPSPEGMFVAVKTGSVGYIKKVACWEPLQFEVAFEGTPSGSLWTVSAGNLSFDM